MPEIVTEEPEFELDDIDTKILPPRPRYRKGAPTVLSFMVKLFVFPNV